MTGGGESDRGGRGGRRWRLRRPAIAALGAVVGLAGVSGGARSFARSSIYPAPAVPVGPPPPGIVEVSLPGAGGEVRVAWAWAGPPPAPGAKPGPVVLYLHGNGENLATLQRAGTLERLMRLGAAAWVALDYPGYGRSSGEPSERALVDAAESGLDWIERRHPGHPVVVIGRSLGAAVAIALAERRPARIAALALISPFSSLTDAAARFYPRWLVRLLVPDGYPSLERASRVRAPTLVIHGEADQLVPASQGRAICDGLPRCAAYLTIAGAGHNDLLAREELWRALGDFLGSLGGPPAPGR